MRKKIENILILFAGVFAFNWTMPLRVLAFSASTVTIETKWLNEDNSQVDLNWKAVADWAWRKESFSPQKKEVYLPVLQIALEIPDQVELFSPAKANLRILDNRNQETFSSFKGSRVILLETQSPKTSHSFVWKMKGAKDREGVLFVQVKFEYPALLIHDSCRRKGYSLTEKNPGGDFLFLAMDCPDADLDLLRVSDDAHFLVDEKATRFQPHLVLPKNFTGTREILVRNKVTRKTSAYILKASAPIPEETAPQEESHPVASVKTPSPLSFGVTLLYGQQSLLSPTGEESAALVMGDLEVSYARFASLGSLRSRVSGPALSVLPYFRIPQTGQVHMDTSLGVALWSDGKRTVSLWPGFAFLFPFAESQKRLPSWVAGPRAELSVFWAQGLGDRDVNLYLGLNPLGGDESLLHSLRWNLGGRITFHHEKEGSSWGMGAELSGSHLKLLRSSDRVTYLSLGMGMWYRWN